MLCVKEILTDHMIECLQLPYCQPDWKYIDVTYSNNKQLLIMTNKFIIFSCEIPFCDVVQIQCEAFNGDYFILLKSKNYGCCVVSLLNKKVIDYWEKGTDIFIDDYVNIGHDQVIVVFPDEDNENFYCTDYRCCLFDTRQSNAMDVDSPLTDRKGKTILKTERILEVNAGNEGYNSAMNALQTRLFSMTNMLHMKNAENAEKQEFIKSSCKALIGSSLGANYCQKDTTGLMDLFADNKCINEYNTEKRENNNNNNQKSRNDTTFKIVKVYEIWKKICFDKLVIGVHAENISNEYLSDITLDGIITGSCCSVVSNVEYKFNIYNVKTFFQESKKSDYDISFFRPNDKHIFMLVTDIPVFTSCESVTYNLKLNFTQNKQKLSCFIGKTVLSTSDIVSGDLLVSSEYSARDKTSNVAFEYASWKLEFSMKSKISSLKTLPELLSKRFKCHYSHIGNVSLIFPTFSTGSELRLSHGNSLCNCAIFTKSEEDASIFLSELKRLLPADVEFIQTRKDNTLLLQKTYNAVRNEISYKTELLEKQLAKITREEFEKNVVVLDMPIKRKINEEDASGYEEKEKLETLVNITNNCFKQLSVDM